MAEEVKKVHIYGIQITLVCAITLATQNVNAENLHYWMTKIARYVLYILLIKGSRVASEIAYKKVLYSTDLTKTLRRTVEDNRRYILIFTIASSILGYSKQGFFDEHFIWLFIAYLICQYPEIDKVMINYGVGMACSFVEGCPAQVIPNDGGDFDGIQRKIAKLEVRSVIFPVKRLFIIIVKSLYGPPNLEEFNKPNRTDLPFLEACGEKPVMINYGVGMACSFFEGYLVQVIPSDGANFVGFQENIAIFESSQHVAFPVKRLFIIITKSLFCPPSLKHFNKTNRPDLPYLEACTSLEDVVRDVAGVTNRTYRNSAYKIHRPNGPLVYLAAECATPLHTLHKVLVKRALYDKLCDVDVDLIVRDFCEQLETTIARSPDCRNKCTLVHYDDTDPNVNLADVLLDKIREIEPNFDEIITQHHNRENENIEENETN